MKSTLKKQEGLRHEFEVVIPASAFSAKKEQELNRLSKKVKVDGFRPGNVPLAVVKKKYGDSVNNDVINELLRESMDKTFKDNNLRPCLEPNVKADKFEEGKDFSYTLSFEVFPEVPNFDFSKIKITKPVAPISEQDIEEALGRIQDSNKAFDPHPTKTKAEKGDIVSIDFTGSKDGVEFEGGKSQGFMIELGSGQFIPGFEDEVVGMKKGDTKKFPITFPKDYHSEALKGAKTEFEVKLNEIYEQKRPDLTDDFAKALGIETAAKLREEIEKQLKKDLESFSFTKAKKALFDALDEKHKFDVPQGMVELDYQSILKQIKAEDPKKSAADAEKEAKKLAERRVRLGIILSELGRANTVQVTNDELRQAIWAKAMSFPGQEQRVIEYYQKNQNAMEQVRGEVLEDKVVKFLFEKVSVTEKQVSRQELMKDDEAEEGGHVHGPDCNHEHGEEGHVHDENCDHGTEGAKKKSTTKKKK
jgi:trigger factor